MQKITRAVRVTHVTFAKVDIEKNIITEQRIEVYVTKPSNRQIIAKANELGMVFVGKEEKVERIWTTPGAFYNLCKETMARYEGDDGFDDDGDEPED